MIELIPEVGFALVPALITLIVGFVFAYVVGRVNRRPVDEYYTFSLSRVAWVIIIVGGLLGFIVNWWMAAMGAWILVGLGAGQHLVLVVSRKGSVYSRPADPNDLGCLVSVFFGSALAGLYVVLQHFIKFGPAIPSP